MNSPIAPLPCPFCGDTRIESDYGFTDDDGALNCCTCKGGVQIGGVKAWNRRPNPETQAPADYHGMEYPLEQLPAIWRTLAEELRGNAKESKADDPELARCFESRAISVLACADQLQWSLAHRSPVDAVPVATLSELEAELREEAKAYWKDGDLVGRDIVHRCASRLAEVIKARGTK